jgi:hypothetical protein
LPLVQLPVQLTVEPSEHLQDLTAVAVIPAMPGAAASAAACIPAALLAFVKLWLPYQAPIRAASVKHEAVRNATA